MTPIILTELTQTCSACPSQWSGRTIDGRSFYARYRYGHLSVEVGGVDVFDAQIGDRYDGVMDTHTMLDTIGIDV